MSVTTITAEDRKLSNSKFKNQKTNPNGINQVSNDSTFRYTNETFSGCDMTASITINTNIQNPDTKKWNVQPYTKVVGELTTVSYSIHMEKKPVRSIGSVNAKDYVMGPRTIAGSLVFSVFNKHFAEDLMTNLNNGYTSGTAFLVDELPPFDLTISAANEYGYRSRLAIYGIRLLNEGQVMSINDVYTENTYQFFATDLEYLNAEMFYTRDKTTKMYKLNDNDIETNKYVDSRLSFKSTGWTADQQNNYDEKMNRAAKLQSLVKQPTRINAPGIVDFTLDPPQTEGVILIKDSNKESSSISLDGERVRRASISLKPGKYNAYFENSKNKLKSNTVAFTVNNFNIKSNLSKYAPIIERVTDTEIYVYSNEPTHNKLKLTWDDADKGSNNIYEIINRRCTLKDLQINKNYTIYTFNETDSLPSVAVKVKTLTNKDELFNQLTLFCYANSRHLVFPNMKIYNDLIAEAKTLAINNNINTTDSLLRVKGNYLNLLKGISDVELKNEYDLRIKACNEIITLSIKLYNDFIEAVNIITPIPIPLMTLNSKYENVFEFDKSISSAEIYKNHGNTVQFYYEVPKYNFKNIEGVDNSFRFNGKPGTKHYIEALDKQIRSAKLEFYVMTQVEKNEFIAKDELNSKVTDKEIDEINKQIAADELKLIETADYKRAFMINAKKLESPILFPPEIETINENVLLRTSINYIVENNYLNIFYLAIATYENILRNEPIYKIQFTSNEPVIAITRLLHGLKADKEYAIWIEDSKGEQLSNPSTFIYNEEFNLDEDEMKEYELKDITNEIKILAKRILPSDIYEDVLSVVENNKTITNYNFINEIISVVVNSTMNKNILINFMREIKYYLGIIGQSDTTMLNDISYSNDICKFNSLTSGTLLIHNVSLGQCISSPIVMKEVNEINTTQYQDIILLIAIDVDLKKKSNLIMINKKEKYMEVL